jgi:hypothetical protein
VRDVAGRLETALERGIELAGPRAARVRQPGRHDAFYRVAVAGVHPVPARAPGVLLEVLRRLLRDIDRWRAEDRRPGSGRDARTWTLTFPRGGCRGSTLPP